MNIILISELINKDGSRISGNKKIDQFNNMTASNSTTDDMVGTSKQGISFFNNFGRVYVGEDDEIEVKTNKKDKPKQPKTPPNKGDKKLRRVAKDKMVSLVEDIFTKKDFDREFVDNKPKDLKLNGIQDISSIRDTNPILIRKVGALKDMIEKNSASGEEKAVIINFLLSMDTTDIPYEYKQELKKKLG